MISTPDGYRVPVSADIRLDAGLLRITFRCESGTIGEISCDSAIWGKKHYMFHAFLDGVKICTIYVKGVSCSAHYTVDSSEIYHYHNRHWTAQEIVDTFANGRNRE